MRNEQGTHGQECYPAVHTFHPDIQKGARPRGLREGKERQRLYAALRVQEAVPRHHPHELRYTFITRCKECGVSGEVVMLWDGHSGDKDVKTSAVDRGYTDYSKEYILAEAEKVNYDL